MEIGFSITIYKERFFMATVQERILHLRAEIMKHDELYEQNRPIIADGEYDALYRELVQLEASHPEFMDEKSPTQRIVTKMVEELKKVRHNSFMGSQEKANDWETVFKFIKRAVGRILVQHKLDGLTVVLHFDKGALQVAVTRGDGEVGEDVTHTVLTIKNLPKRIPFKGKLELRMEAVIPFEDFARINEEENADYSNPRNLVSGTLRQLDPEITRRRNVQGIVFEFQSIEAEGIEFKNDSERLAFIKEQGFQVVDTRSFEPTEEGLEAIKAYIEEVEKEIRKTLPYLIDGLIIKFDNLEIREELGRTNKHPRWSIAYKFEAQEATTTMYAIAEQVGKTGQITPVGELVTVNIGVNVSRASLHNYGYVSEGEYYVGNELRIGKDIRIGDTVTVIRANDVIPKITNSIKELRTGVEQIITPPTHCPECGSPTEFIGANLYCTGINCKPQLAGKIEHFASRKCLNVDGLGESTVEKFFELGIIRNFLDLYRLNEHREQILSIDGYGEKKLDKVLAGLEEAKKAPLSKVLTALSIRLIGSTQGKELSKQFTSMNEMLDASTDRDAFYQQIISFEGFGDEKAKSLTDFFANTQNRELIEGLLAVGFIMIGEARSKEEKEATQKESIVGKTFVITGKLSKGRDEFKTMIEEMGGKSTGSVSKKTDYLLLGSGEEGSSKHNKAIELEITILSEEDFWNLVG
jgi:DNA ligase (NAD+)